MKKELKLSAIYIIVVLIVSWLYTYVIFQNPKTIGLYAFIMLIPATVALIINLFRYRSVAKIFSPLTSKITIKSVVFSILYPILFIGLLSLLVYLFRLAEFNSDKLVNLKHVPPVIGIAIGFLLMFGEEYGWRGFLLNELNKAKGQTVAAFVVGIVWAMWHAPLIYNLAQFTHMEHPVLLTIIQMGSVIVFSFPFAYAYFLSGSIIPPMLFHFVWNIYNPIALGNIYQNKPGIFEGNMMYINGEGMAGIFLGMLFIFWYISHFKNKKHNAHPDQGFEVK